MLPPVFNYGGITVTMIGLVGGWLRKRLSPQLILLILLLYAAYRVYDHYTALSQSITDLSNEVAQKDQLIQEQDDSIKLAASANAELDRNIQLLTLSYAAINKTSAELRTEKANLQIELDVKKKQLRERMLANVENDQCVNAAMPNYVISLLNDAAAKARTGDNQNKDYPGSGAGRMDKAMSGTASNK